MRPPTPPPQPPPDQPQEQQEPPPQQPPPEQRQVRRLIVEVIEARELLPKDGQGSSSPYVIVDFDGQRRRTSTKYRDLNPIWNEALDFIVTDPNTMEYEELNIEVYNDKRMASGAGRKNHFLGRVKMYGSQFVRRGEEGLVYLPLEKKSVFSWIRGEIGLRIYYFDDIVEEGPPCDGGGGGGGGNGGPPPEVVEIRPETRQEETRVMEGPVPTEVGMETGGPPPSSMAPVVVIEEAPPHPGMVHHHQPPSMPPYQDHPPPRHYHPPQHHQGYPPPPSHHQNQDYPPPPSHHQHQDYPPPPSHHQHQDYPPPPPHHQHPPPPHDMHHHQPPPEAVHMLPPTPDMRRMRMGGGVDRARVLRRTNSDYSPRIINGNSTGEPEKISSFDLVEPMQYLFVRIVKARGLAPNESPFVKIRTSNHLVRSKPATYRPCEPPENPEWQQVFALGHNKDSTPAATLEISIWDAPNEHFLGGVCFDLSDVPVRDPPDSPLAPQWYHLEGGATAEDPSRVTGDVQLAVWIGTQADDAFPEAWCSDAPPSVSYTRSKVYQSPKLWYLRVTIIEAQELQIPPNLPPLTVPEIRVKGQLAFQSARTRRGSMNSNGAAVHWNEDLIFVAGEPLEDQLILLVEDRTAKDPILLGHVVIPVSAIEQRLDERHLASKWVTLQGGGGDGGCGSYTGRIHLRLCLEGGYHVLDEAAHVCSDFRPTAKQLWKPAVGVLELGILGARGLLPMKTKGSGGKGSTDAYCVAKYGKKWVRTRTITESFDPRWNEQYTWQVYDPCTVLTIGVFDNWRMFSDMGEDKPDFRIGKVRIRVSTLASNKVYKNSYPLLVLLRNGLKKMGEIDIAVRFACPSLLPDTCSIYGQPLLPRMHYLRPLGVAQQEALRGSATKMVAAWLARSEPPLGPEVVRYMLDADSHTWSMRKSKANWFRIVAVLAWVIGLVKWLDNIKRWRNPITTILVHMLYLVLVWYPDLIVPTGFLYVFLIGVWYYRFKPKIPAGMDTRLSQAEMVDPDELDEEFDTVPSSRPPDIVRVRYDRLRILAARVQTVLGDLAAQGERVQALVSWRDPRATKLFIGLCLIVTIILYAVPPKMVAVALGFYFLRHPMFREPMPPSSLNFFRRLPSLSDRLI